MTEFATVPSSRLRRSFLATASAIAMLNICGVRQAAASDDESHPAIWIELGAQAEGLAAKEEQYIPPFIVETPRPAPETIDPLSIGHMPRYSVGGEGKISVTPNGTDWVLSVGVRYGRTKNSKHVHQQSYSTQPLNPPQSYFQRALPFVDTEIHHSESHAVLDFQAGKDVGLGLFGSHTTSTVGLGVRFAQFGSSSKVAFKSDPEVHPTFKYLGTHKVIHGARYHVNTGVLAARQSFSGLGPSLTWTSTEALAGNKDAGELQLDWGINAAILFGRQKANVHHQTTQMQHIGQYAYPPYRAYRTTVYRHLPPDQARSHSVTVPNVGGFAGLSLRYDDAKISFGYRADIFFGAMDGGIDARETYNRSFYGPFATLSIGLGG